MRETLQEKYSKLYNREKELRKEIAIKLFPGVEELVGKKLYKSYSCPSCPKEEPEEWTITGFSSVGKDRHELADYLGGYLFPYGKKVTKALVAEAEEYIKKYESAPLDMFNVILYIEKHTTYSNGTTAKSTAGEIFDPETGFTGNVSLNKEDFKEKIEKDKEEYEKYYAPREGYVACERCGKQVPENEAVKYKLIYQAWDNYRGRYVTSRIGTFCSGNCAMNEQMALEG